MSRNPHDMTLEQLKLGLERVFLFSTEVNGREFMGLLDAYIDKRIDAHAEEHERRYHRD